MIHGKKGNFCKNGFLERKTLNKTYTYKGHIIEVDQPGEWCNVCEESILENADLRATEKQISDFQSQIDDLLTSGEIRRIRKKLKLTQKQAASFCGGGPNAFSCYERGEAAPMRSTSNLLRLLGVCLT